MTDVLELRLWRTTYCMFVFTFWRPKRSQSPEMLGSHSHCGVLTLAGGLAVPVVLALGFVLRAGGSAEDTAVPRSPPVTKSAQRAAANAPRTWRTLNAGDRAPRVADLQRALSTLGLYSQPVDGVYGDSTGAAVRAFQQSRGLVADGVAGPATLEALVVSLSAGAKNDASILDEALTAVATAGGLSPASFSRYHGMVVDSLERLDSLSPGRVATLALVFHDAAATATDLDSRGRPRSSRW